MNRRLPTIIIRLGQKLVPPAGAIGALAMVIHTSGCASGRPAPLLIDPSSASAPTVASYATESGFNLKVVTYNIWGLPGWMTGAHSGRYPRIARELERLDPDIALLQEAWTAKARKAAPSSHHWSIARAAGQHTFFQQSGLVTLSRFPIIGGQFYPFSRAAFPDRFVNKGVLKVTVQLPDAQVLNIWNVHLQDGGSPEIRRTQVCELIARVRAADNGQIADLVGGDFNCAPGSEFYRELANGLGPSVQELAGIEPFVTWDGLCANPAGGETLDYIFVRCGARFQAVQAMPRVAFAAANFEQRLSDHLGIEALVKLGSAPVVAGVFRPTLENASFTAINPDEAGYGGGE